MTTLASLLSQFSTQYGVYSGDKSTVATDAQAVADAQAKQTADAATEGTDLSSLQKTLDAISVQAKSEGFAINVPA